MAAAVALAGAVIALLTRRGIARLSCVHEHDLEIIQLLARREGVARPLTGRPRVLAAVIGALVFLASRDWRGPGRADSRGAAGAFDACAGALMPALAGHWAAAG